MSGELYHSQLTGELVHVMHTWAVADQAARLALNISSLPNHDDYLYKICLQLDNMSYWILTNVTTMAWSACNNTFANITYTEAVNIPQVLTDQANIAFNCALGQMATLTIAGARTLDNPTNLKAGTTMMIKITHSGNGRTLAYGSAYKWQGGTAGVLSTTTGTVDLLSMTCFDGSTVQCVLMKDFR